MEYETIAVKGRSIAYQSTGTGSAVVFLHGWPQSSHMWRKIVPVIAKQHRVILIDLPGLAESQSHDVFNTGLVAGIVADAVEALGVTDFHLAGHDIGAWALT